MDKFKVKCCFLMLFYIVQLKYYTAHIKVYLFYEKNWIRPISKYFGNIHAWTDCWDIPERQAAKTPLIFCKLVCLRVLSQSVYNNSRVDTGDWTHVSVAIVIIDCNLEPNSALRIVTSVSLRNCCGIIVLSNLSYTKNFTQQQLRF